MDFWIKKKKERKRERNSISDVTQFLTIESREPGKFISRIDRRKFNFIERTSLVIGEFHFDSDLKAGRKERSIIIKFAYLIDHGRLCEVAFSSKTLSIFSLSMKWNDKRHRFEVRQRCLVEMIGDSKIDFLWSSNR